MGKGLLNSTAEIGNWFEEHISGQKKTNK